MSRCMLPWCREEIANTNMFRCKSHAPSITCASLMCAHTPHLCYLCERRTCKRHAHEALPGTGLHVCHWCRVEAPRAMLANCMEYLLEQARADKIEEMTDEEWADSLFR